MRHKNIKRFSLSGDIKDDADFPRLRAQYETLMTQNMRDEGMVPVFGLSAFSTSYNYDKKCYEFVVSIYGVYVGKRSSKKIDGYTTDGRKIMRRVKNG